MKNNIYSSNAALVDAGVEIVTNRMVTAVTQGLAQMECTFAGRPYELACDVVIPVCRRLPVLDLYDGLKALENSGLKSITRIGDAEAPNTIAAAVHAGYRAGMDLGREIDLARVYGKREHSV